MIKPLGNKVYIKMEYIKKTADGFAVEESKYIRESAEVLGVGPDVKVCKKGDRVLFKSWAIDSCDLGEKDTFNFIQDSDVLGTYEV